MQYNQFVDYLIQLLYRVMPYLAATIGITMISFTPMGRAAVSWLKGHVNRGCASELAGEIERLRQELDETQERLNFTERHLSQLPLGVTPSRTPTPRNGELRIPTPV